MHPSAIRLSLVVVFENKEHDYILEVTERCYETSSSNFESLLLQREEVLVRCLADF